MSILSFLNISIAIYMMIIGLLLIISRNRMYIGTNNDADHIPTVCDVTKFPKSLWRVSVPVQFLFA